MIFSFFSFFPHSESKISGARISEYLLEKSRVARQVLLHIALLIQCRNHNQKRFIYMCTERPINANPELKFGSTFCILPSYALRRVTFCVIIYTVSQSKSSTLFCKLDLHVLRQLHRA